VQAFRIQVVDIFEVETCLAVRIYLARDDSSQAMTLSPILRLTNRFRLDYVVGLMWEVGGANAGLACKLSQSDC
jgi:hypothetical protein